MTTSVRILNAIAITSVDKDPCNSTVSSSLPSLLVISFTAIVAMVWRVWLSCCRRQRAVPGGFRRPPPGCLGDGGAGGQHERRRRSRRRIFVSVHECRALLVHQLCVYIFSSKFSFALIRCRFDCLLNALVLLPFAFPALVSGKFLPFAFVERFSLLHPSFLPVSHSGVCLLSIARVCLHASRLECLVSVAFPFLRRPAVCAAPRARAGHLQGSVPPSLPATPHPGPPISCVGQWAGTEAPHPRPRPLSRPRPLPMDWPITPALPHNTFLRQSILGTDSAPL